MRGNGHHSSCWSCSRHCNRSLNTFTKPFWRVTLPLLAPAIWVIVVLRIVDAFRMIELIYLMTRGGPGGATETLSWYIYSTGFLNQDLGYAAAQAVVMIIVISIVAQIFVRRLEYRE
ncbi:MAG: sugar ABC transporter permease [Alphaproteobacteria bacterium]|nr:MAG: sugar ABC transporter permease [Alphaproteobacteria bacterium]